MSLAFHSYYSNHLKVFRLTAFKPKSKKRNLKIEKNVKYEPPSLDSLQFFIAAENIFRVTEQNKLTT